MRRVMLLGLAMTLISCATGTLEPRQRPLEGFNSGRLTCAQNLVEESMGDFYANAIGFETVSDAIEDFRLSEGWQIREDWHTLIAGDMSTPPDYLDNVVVEFTDERGWIYLAVDVTRVNDTWLVSGYQSCVPRYD